MRLNWKANNKVTIWVIESPIRMTIHKYVGCGDELFFDCRELGINDVDLHTTDLEIAEEQAVKLMEQHLSELNARATKILETYRKD